MRIEINPVVRDVMQMIENAGYSVYLVGGTIRDEILGIDNNDYDLSTNMPLELINNYFSTFKLMRENDHRNTGVLHLNGLEIEISSFHGNSIEEDLAKRDFTINAIGANKEGELIDPYNGIDDINNKVIRLVDSSGVGIVIDPLRILRAIRFSTIYGFKIDDNTKKIINDKKELLSKVAYERIYNEFVKIIMSDKPGDTIKDNKDIFFEIIPDLKQMDGFKQNNPHHIYDVFEHTLKVLDNTPKDLILRLSALFHDIGKPLMYYTDDNGVGHFYFHEVESEKIFREFAEKYRVDLRTRGIVSKLILYHDRQFSLKHVKMVKTLQNFGTDQLDRLYLLKKADILGQNPQEKDEKLMELNRVSEAYNNLIEQQPCLTVRDLKINGDKLIEMGFEGKQIGFILKDVLNKVTEKNISNDVESIDNYVRKTY